MGRANVVACRLDQRTVGIARGHPDLAAGDVAGDGADGRRQDALLDVLERADAAHHDGGVLRRDLDQRAQLQRDVPALHLHVDGLIDGVLGHGLWLGPLFLRDVALLIDRQIDHALGVAALVDLGADARVDQRHLVGLPVEVVGAGEQRLLPDADAALGNQRHGQSALDLGALRGGRDLLLDAHGIGLHRVAFHDADAAGGNDGRPRALGDPHAKQVVVDAIAAGLQHGLLRSLEAAGGEKRFGIQHRGDLVVRERRRDEHAFGHRGAVDRGQFPVEAIWNVHDRKLLDLVQHMDQRNDVESGTEDAGLRAFLATDADDATARQLRYREDPVEVSDAVVADVDERRGAEQGDARDQQQRREQPRCRQRTEHARQRSDAPDQNK